MSRGPYEAGVVDEVDVEVCAELARQWDEEDVVCPPHTRDDNKQKDEEEKQ